MSFWCNWDVPSSQAGRLSHFFESLTLASVAVGPIWVAQAPSSATSKSCRFDVPISFRALGGGGQDGGGLLWEKKGSDLSREHPQVNAASSQSHRWGWSCPDSGCARGAAAGAVPIASLTSRGSKPTPAARAELELGREMINNHPAPQPPLQGGSEGCSLHPGAEIVPRWKNQ